MQKLLPLVSLALLVAAAPPGAELARPNPVFVPERFFSGRLESQGTLKIIMKGPETLRVVSSGRVEHDTLVIDQVVHRSGAETEKRQWRIKKLGQGRYAGTISDAIGPINGNISGNRMYLKYRLKKDKVAVEQWVYLQPDGRTALNRMTLHKLGMKVGSIEETIRRVD